MKRIPMFLAASFTLAIASAALAADTRSPTTTDEIRAAYAAQRRGNASVQAPASACEQMPTSTDQARAATGALLTASTVAASGTAVSERNARTPTSTDDARALVAARTNGHLVASAARHEEVCASCACKMGEQHARASADPCGCHKRT